jgi:predicted anti-sigma-YlaC factor YlaD
MSCARYREAASARLDGEPLGLSATALEHHLASCAGCAEWLATVERAGRGLRISGSVPPDLSGRILHRVVLPVARLNRRRWLVRAGLAVLGFVQWALALPALFGQGMAMQMSVHAAHESAAWNLAMGASFLAVAVKPARAIGTLPILTTFVTVLSVLSIPDVLAGAVAAARLASHAGVLAGLVLVAVLYRSERLPVPGPAAEGSGPASRPRSRRGAA